MKRMLLLVGLMLMMVMTSVFAAGASADPVAMNLGQWYKSNPMPSAPGVSGETVFQSPRSVVIVRQAPQGTSLAPHYHTMVDEYVYVVEGGAELLLGGDWIKLKAGDVHMNPRGSVHALKVTDAKGVKFVSVFAPPQPAKGDMVSIPTGEPLQSPAGLIDSSPGVGGVVSLKDWQGAPIGQQGMLDSFVNIPDYDRNDGFKSITAIETPRSKLQLNEAGYGASRRSKDDRSDAILIVVSGVARAETGNSGRVLAKNDLLVIPAGTEHVLKLMLGDNIRFISVVATQAKP